MAPERSGSAFALPSLGATPIRRGEIDHHAREPPRARPGEPRPRAGLGSAPAAAAPRDAEAGRRSGPGRRRPGDPRRLRRRQRHQQHDGDARLGRGTLRSPERRTRRRPARRRRRPESTETSDTANGELPEETAGPYPGDGSNGANVLTESGVVRSDITPASVPRTTKAEGVPLRITMTINEFANDKQATGRRARSTSGTATRPGSTPSTPRAIGERELPARRAGDRREGQGHLHHASSRPATPAAGRTSTSRSTRAWPRRPTAATRSPPRRWR